MISSSENVQDLEENLQDGSVVDNGTISSLKILTNIAKRPQVDIEFTNLTYIARSGFSLNKKKHILNGISGAFRSGELSGILGPSGSGKTSLMNILADYSSVGVTGNVNINGQPRNKYLYHKLSCYIMQDEIVQSGLTVEEAMNIAANLKLGSELNSDEKKIVIDEILDTLGLTKSRDTRSEKLSGGQRKRLIIALELVNNPPIIFLDEPTSGLDTYSIKQLVKLLKFLANSGRTIICTIHQPSASIFSLFDHVYFLARGKCIYQGSPSLLVPFMAKLEFHCPVTHNPADVAIELSQNNIENINLFSNAIKNGEESQMLEISASNNKKIHSRTKIEGALPSGIITDMSLPTSFLTQFIILYKRMLIQRRRNMTSLWIQVLHHIISGCLIGSIFYDIGNDGTNPIANFKFCLSVMVFFMYTYVMTPILLFPLEFQLLQREHFNRWYGLKAYFMALTLASLPVIVILGMELLVVTYWMSGQIMDLRRFVLFSLCNILTALCSEGFGLAIGATFNVLNGTAVGPTILAPLLALSVYGLGFGPEIETVMKILMRLSYLRYGLAGLCIALYTDRPRMECHDEQSYCHYSDTRVLLRDMGMSSSNYELEMFGLLGFTLFHRAVAYFVLHFRLQEEFSDRIRKYLIILLRRK